MALKKSYSSRFGTTHSNAYHKVTSVSWNSNQEYLRGDVSVFATEAARTANSGSLGSINFIFEYDPDIDKSWVVQSYEHLKTLDNYEDAEDV
jgi:hypothetical protein